MELRTERLRLVLQTREEVLAMVDGLSPADRAEVSPAWLARIHGAAEPDPWLFGFIIVHLESGEAIGHCGFKGPPDTEAAVEIAYGIDEAQRNQGYATEAALALVQFAREQQDVRIIRAHTLPEANASTHVLTKCGFRCLGEVVDPEDGVVWRWEM